MNIRITTPKFSALEASKSVEGRKYLDRQREKHKLDILQPSDPMFRKVYGKQHKKLAKDLVAKEQKSKDMFTAKEEKKQWEKNQKTRKKIRV